MKGLVAPATLALVACASQRAQPTNVPADGQTTVVKLLLGGRDCAPGSPIDPDLTASVRNETPELVTALRGQKMLVVEPMPDPSARDVAEAAAPLGQHPLILIYSGHGRLADQSGRVLSDAEHLNPPHRPLHSVVCLKDGPLAIDGIVRNFRAPTPVAVFVVNACYSAHVDLRGVGGAAGPDVALIAGSRSAIAASGNTPLARELAKVVASPLDCDGDGVASDFELFSPLERAFPRGGGNPDPKCLRQLRRSPGLFPTRSGTGECVLPPPPLESPAAPFFTGGRRHLRYPGRLPDDVAALASGFSTPCSDPVGQCFDVSNQPPP